MSRFDVLKTKSIKPSDFDLGDGASVVLQEPPDDLKNGAYKLERLTDKQKEILEAELRCGIQDAQKQNISTSGITIYIYGRTARPNEDPDKGVGIMDGPQSILLAVNPDKIEGNFVRQHLARLITHECNHIERAYYGVSTDTIGAALVSEGLALASEILAGHSPAKYNQPVSPQVLADYVRDVLPALEYPKKENYYRWMFGTDPTKPDPTHGGYPLGHAIVNSYMKSGHDLAEATATEAEVILTHWKNELFTKGISRWVEENFDREYSPPKSPVASRSSLPVPKFTEYGAAEKFDIKQG